MYDALIEWGELLGIPIQDVVTPWAQTSTFSFFQQLMIGVRYLDVRAAYDGSDWRTYHFELGNTIATLVADVALFASNYASEIIVLEVSHFDALNPSNVTYDDLLNVILDQLEPYMIPRSVGLKLSYSELLKMKRNVIVTFDNEDAIYSQPLFWSDLTIINTYADTVELSTMASFNTNQATYFTKNVYPSSVEKLYKLSWILTPDKQLIIDSIFSESLPHSLLQLADIANANLTTWINSTVSKGLKLGNIFILDNASVRDVMAIVLLNL